MANLISLSPSVFEGTFADLLADFPGIASAAEPDFFEFDGETIEADGFEPGDRCILRWRGPRDWDLRRKG